MEIAQIAAVCHEANRAYCAMLGDTSQVLWNHAPEWQRQTCVDGVTFYIDGLRSGIMRGPWELHENWCNHKIREGWKYGPVKNAETKEHPCLVPWNELPLEQRLKDQLFASIVSVLGPLVPKKAM